MPDNNYLAEHDTGCVGVRSSMHSSGVRLSDCAEPQLTVKDVVVRLIEKHVGAWKALPNKVRNAMIERPQDFRLVDQVIKPGGEQYPPHIEYNGTAWRYTFNHKYCVGGWMIDDLIIPDGHIKT